MKLVNIILSHHIMSLFIIVLYWALQFYELCMPVNGWENIITKLIPENEF